MSSVKTDRIYYPMLVSINGTNEFLSSEQSSRVWEKYRTLPRLKQDILTDEQVPARISELQNNLRLADEVVGVVSLCIRKLFFEEINFADAERAIGTVLSRSGQSIDVIKRIVQFIQQEIMTIVPKAPLEDLQDSPNKIIPAKIAQLPLLKALSEYPRLGDQPITNEKIKIKSQAEPVRPSLTNWIHYYREELGIGFHDQVTRGHFLFQSENGKRLSAEERERINLILKSIEEEFPIDIDADRQTIVFPVKQTGAPTAPFGGAAQPATNPLFPRQSPVPARPVKPFQPAVPQDLPTAEPVPTPSAASKPSFFDRQFRPAKNVAGDTLHFSTGHVLPGEKNAESGVAAPAAAPQSRPTVSTPPPSSFRPRGIVQDRGAALPRSPYSIRPLRMRDDDEVAS